MLALRRFCTSSLRASTASVTTPLTLATRHSGRATHQLPCYHVDDIPYEESEEGVLLSNAQFIEVDAAKLREKLNQPSPQPSSPPSSSEPAHNERNGSGCCGSGGSTHHDTHSSPPEAVRYLRRPPSTLSAKEKKQLTDMIYETHYKSELRDGSAGVKALMYQAGLELKYIEDFVEGQATAFTSRDDVRREVKRLVLQRVDLHKPLSYILGFQPFYGCAITCVQPLLCPRQETELWTHWLVSNYLSKAQDVKCMRVLDVCSGTGCIGIAIAKQCLNAQVLAVDILPQAVEISNENARQNKVNERYECVLSDLFEAVDAMHDKDPENFLKYDVLVSNPPYILPDQYEELPHTITHWESKLALVGDAKREHTQYQYFQELCEKGAKYLKSADAREGAGLKAAPSIVIEVGIQATHIASIMDQHPEWTDVELHTDYAGQPRWVTARRR